MEQKTKIPKTSELKAARKPVKNINIEHKKSLSLLERVAIVVTDKVGTMGFFIIILVWTVVWLAWNMWAPRSVRFDPYPAFVLWLFISNLIQIHLMPLIMVGQNLQGRHAEMRAESDFDVNVKAEREVEAILLHLEEQAYKIEHILEILRSELKPSAGK